MWSSADAEHHAGDEADGELHAAMRQPEPDRDHAAGNRRQQDEDAIIGEQRDVGHEERSRGRRSRVERCELASAATPNLERTSLTVRDVRRKALMRACIQRVSEASVTVDGEVTGRIGRGLVVLLGVGTQDGAAEVDWLAEKIVGLRIFEDDAGKMNRSLTDVGGAMLVVSQFTLFGDCAQGPAAELYRRRAAGAGRAAVRGVRRAGARTGRRGADRRVSRAHGRGARERRAGDAVDRYGRLVSARLLLAWPDGSLCGVVTVADGEWNLRRRLTVRIDGLRGGRLIGRRRIVGRLEVGGGRLRWLAAAWPANGFQPARASTIADSTTGDCDLTDRRSGRTSRGRCFARLRSGASSGLRD